MCGGRPLGTREAVAGIEKALVRITFRPAPRLWKEGDPGDDSVVPALHRRFGWFIVPVWAVLGDVLVAIGYCFILLVYRVNSYTASTIQVVPGQAVISAGPYAIVRHPMYASGSLYIFGTPLALGWYWGFVAIAAMMPFLLWRLLDEERILTRDLPGYAEYRQRVRHRLVPMIW